MQKYQAIFMRMADENKELFDNFSSVHEAFILNPDANKARFNEVGREVLDVIRDYERILCGKTESGQYGKFSSNLSQKFWDEVRKVYRKIDFVGVK
jgi:hypothetical protein